MMGYTDKDRVRFFRLRKEGFTIDAISKKTGISTRTLERWSVGDIGGNTSQDTPLTRGRQPPPKPYEKLSDLAKRMIAPDGFPLFLEKTFGWEVVPWELKAAKVSVDAILDHSQKHYGIANQPPGSGKSSLWTFALPAWLNLGGGSEDPALGRRMRFQLGHASMKISTNYVKRIARLYDTPRPFYDPQTAARGEIVLSHEFGRLRPMQSLGDVSLWQNDQFVVAQMEDVDLTDKDPTFMAVSSGAEYIGARCEYASWDDLVTEKLSRTIDAVQAQSTLFQKEAEQRIEPGGILWLVGQRIKSYDLFRDRLDATWIDDSNNVHQKYFHIVFPAHNEATCDGDHRQWDAEPEGDGCLLDAKRLPWVDLLKVRNDVNYRTLFQQEDVDPAVSLVTKAMLEGGGAYETDHVTGLVRRVDYPGCFNHERAFGEFPDTERVSGLVNYVCVDPSSTGNWAIEWWATRGEEDVRYLIWAFRGKQQAGDLLDWDDANGRFTGWMERLQVASTAAGRPIRAWVVEVNAAQRFLFGYRHFKRWKGRWPFVEVIPHQTQRNRNDPTLGVEALLRHKYRDGLADLPRKSGDLVALTYMNAKTHELTTWPNGGTDDTVMADWFGEVNMSTILRVGRRPIRRFTIEAQLAPYLRRQLREVPVVRSWEGAPK